MMVTVTPWHKGKKESEDLPLILLGTINALIKTARNHMGTYINLYRS